MSVSSVEDVSLTRIFLSAFASRALKQASAAIFAILGQDRTPRPQPRSWAESIKRDFGYDPLRDNMGERMKWARRLAPKAKASR
jgi:hypothetical protein